MYDVQCSLRLHVCFMQAGWTLGACMQVFRDIVSPHKTTRGMNKSIPPDEINRYGVSPLKLKLDIKHKMLIINILQCQCIVSGRSCGPLLYIFDIYLFFQRTIVLKKTGLENLEQSLYLCILWFWILITAYNYQLYTFPNVALCLQHFIHWLWFYEVGDRWG